MYYSKNNIIVPIRKNKPIEYAILNPLSGSFNRVNETEYQLLNSFKESGGSDPTNHEFYKYLLERGYLFADKDAETEKVHQEFAKFQAEIDKFSNSITVDTFIWLC